jgi:hypothetical protein
VSVRSKLNGITLRFLQKTKHYFDVILVSTIFLRVLLFTYAAQLPSWILGPRQSQRRIQLKFGAKVVLVLSLLFLIEFVSSTYLAMSQAPSNHHISDLPQYTGSNFADRNHPSSNDGLRLGLSSKFPLFRFPTNLSGSSPMHDPSVSNPYSPFLTSNRSIIGGWTDQIENQLFNTNVPNFVMEWDYTHPKSSCIYCQAVIGFQSYSLFSGVVSSYASTWKQQGISWVMYNPEPEGTPSNENSNPVYYSGLFYTLAHKYGLKVILAPSITYFSLTDAKKWVNLSDIFDYQGEYIEQYIGAEQYASAVCSVASSMHSINQNAIIFIEVVADGTSKPVQAYQDAVAQCGSQFVGVYTSSFSWSNEMTFLTSVGLAHY